jgi:hypothetical protein
MVTLCHAVKGGSGTTVVCCGIALSNDRPTLLVDLDGDLDAALGTVDTDRPGVGDWLRTDLPTDRLDELTIDVTTRVSLIARGATPTGDLDRWRELGEWMAAWEEERSGEVVIDTGTRALPVPFIESCPNRLLVTRACYLGLRRIGSLPVAPTGVVHVVEPGRTLAARDIERSCGASIVATVPWDPNVARAVDAGLLASRRIPRVLRRGLRRVA